MGTSLKGYGSYKRDLLLNIYANFGFTDFTYSAAAEMQGFDRGAFYNLYCDGWLSCKKNDTPPSMWRLSGVFQNILVTNNITEEQLDLLRKQIKNSEKKGSRPVIDKPRLSPRVQSPLSDNSSSNPLPARILKAIPEMLNDKEAYTAFSSDLAEIILKHATLWIEKEKVAHENSRHDGIPFTSNGFDRLQCPRCQFLNIPDASFCGHCGNQLQDTVLEKTRKKNLGLRMYERS